MKECLLRGDFPRLHQVLRAVGNQRSAWRARFSNEHIERLYACALNAGAYCARISGAVAAGS